MRALALALVLAGGAAPLAAQDVAARLQGRVPATLARAVVDIARDAAAGGLPVEPLIQKTIEGGAKGIPDDRVIAAVRALVGRLEATRGALREAGIVTPSPAALEAGADALNAGMTARHVRDLGRVSRPPYDPVLTLRVAATLTALGVPPQQGVQLMTQVIRAGRAPGTLLDLPNEVQQGMARGATAAEAAGELGQEGQQGQQQSQQGQQGQDRPIRKP